MKKINGMKYCIYNNEKIPDIIPDGIKRKRTTTPIIHNTITIQNKVIKQKYEENNSDSSDDNNNKHDDHGENEDHNYIYNLFLGNKHNNDKNNTPISTKEIDNIEIKTYWEKRRLNALKKWRQKNRLEILEYYPEMYVKIWPDDIVEIKKLFPHEYKKRGRKKKLRQENSNNNDILYYIFLLEKHNF